MTMILAAAYANLVFIACDTRMSLTLHDDSVRHVDGHGKLHRLDSGWLAGTGEGRIIEEVFRSVDPAASTPEEVGATIAAAAERVEAQGVPADKTWFFLAVGGEKPAVYALNRRGEVEGDRGSNILFSVPPGADGIKPAVNQALRLGMGHVQGAGDLVRLVASAFQAVRSVSEYVGPDIELAIDADGLFVDRYRASIVSLIKNPVRELLAATEAPKAVSYAANSISTDKLDSLEIDSTRGMRLNPAVDRPTGWTSFIDLAAQDDEPVISLPGLVVLANGDAEFSGTVASESFTAPIATFGGTIEFEAGASVVRAPSGSLLVSGETGLSLQSPAGAVTLGNGSGLIELIGGSSLGEGVDVGGTGGRVGFYGGATQTKPTITGSRGGNAALGSLLDALALLGLITNNTSA